MKTELKKRWMKALRSGIFKQGRCALLSEGKYCCLGVLCHITKIPVMSSNHTKSTPYDDERKILGLSNVQVDRFTAMNDGQRLSFKQIAKRIEKDPYLTSLVKKKMKK